MLSADNKVNIAVEGFVDEVIVRRLLEYVGLDCGLVRSLGGKANLINQLPKLRQAARFRDWVVVFDLDHDASCAPEYLRILFPDGSDQLIARVAVRQVESWLLADRERLGSFLGISSALIPIDTDALDDPKLILVNLARRTRRTRLREDIVPRSGSGLKHGPAYPSRIAEFVQTAGNRWRPEVAEVNSESLHRAIEALRSLRS